MNKKITKAEAKRLFINLTNKTWDNKKILRALQYGLKTLKLKNFDITNLIDLIEKSEYNEAVYNYRVQMGAIAFCEAAKRPNKIKSAAKSFMDHING